MPTFDFYGTQHVRSGKTLVDLLVQHWNKRLPKGRKISVDS